MKRKLTRKYLKTFWPSETEKELDRIINNSKPISARKRAEYRKIYKGGPLRVYP